MIQLKSDCLIFQTHDGEQIPCSVEWVTLELMGEGAELVDPEVVHHASAAVLHYFKNELGRQSVSVGEFAMALEKVLRSFGLSVYADHSVKPPCQPPVKPCPKSGKHLTGLRVLETNLSDLASNPACQGFELVFFAQLRRELKTKLDQSPHIVRFHGLRDCVKLLAGTGRWNRRCQFLDDQIVDFLRSCWETEPGRRSCALMVV